MNPLVFLHQPIHWSTAPRPQTMPAMANRMLWIQLPVLQPQVGGDMGCYAEEGGCPSHVSTHAHWGFHKQHSGLGFLLGRLQRCSPCHGLPCGDSSCHFYVVRSLNFSQTLLDPGPPYPGCQIFPKFSFYCMFPLPHHQLLSVILQKEINAALGHLGWKIFDNISGIFFL